MPALFGESTRVECKGGHRERIVRWERRCLLVRRALGRARSPALRKFDLGSADNIYRLHPKPSERETLHGERGTRVFRAYTRSQHVWEAVDEFAFNGNEREA